MRLKIDKHFINKGEKMLIEELNKIDGDNINKHCLPERKVIIELLKASFNLLFPKFFTFDNRSQKESLAFIETNLTKQIAKAFNYCDCQKQCNASALTNAYLDSLLRVKKSLLTDIEALYDGDPAAISKDEIIICYPGFYAIMIYRLAHELYCLKVPYLPRIMSEYAHTKTGIDIHPGAKIGDYFCIDHGTGIVIGETSTLGNNVKLYQGVTIGAKSFALDNKGNPIKGGKRHPDIGNNVIIYANATILGAETFVGDNSVIGANVWLTSSLASNEKIFYEKKKAD